MRRASVRLAGLNTSTLSLNSLTMTKRVARALQRRPGRTKYNGRGERIGGRRCVCVRRPLGGICSGLASPMGGLKTPLPIRLKAPLLTKGTHREIQTMGIQQISSSDVAR
jgi:hypothetical protein